MRNSESINALNNLLARTYDAENGYKEAAKNVESLSLSQTFKANAEKRYTFGHEIKDCIKALGGTPNKGQTLEGKIHQVWMDIRSTFASNDETAILKEVERGERDALVAYDDALDTLSKGTAEYIKIENQRKQIEQVIKNMRGLVPIYAK